MDVDAFAAAHREQWSRLDALTKKRSLTGAEAEELVDLYQRTATQLSLVQSSTDDPYLVGYLTRLVATARSRVTGANPPSWRSVALFFVALFPAAVYRARWWWIWSGLAFTVVACAAGWWVAADPSVQAALAPPEDVQQLVEEDFAEYYSSEAASAFAARVWTNNAWVAAMALVAGAMFCLPAVYVLGTNAVNVGIVGGLMVANGRADVFFGLLTPHGLLELTAVFVAAGAGIRLGWQLIDPGPTTRAEAFAREGRAAVSIALGLVVVLAVSGVIEAFVTPSGLPTWARIGIGALAWLGFLAYVWVYGGRAARAGFTGDVVGAASRTASAPVSG